MIGWRLIELAPKDGSEWILFWRGRQYIGSWRAGGLGEPQPGTFAWRSSCGGQWADPTHFHPLLTPPEIEK